VTKSMHASIGGGERRFVLMQSLNRDLSDIPGEYCCLSAERTVNRNAVLLASLMVQKYGLCFRATCVAEARGQRFEVWTCEKPDAMCWRAAVSHGFRTAGLPRDQRRSHPDHAHRGRQGGSDSTRRVAMPFRMGRHPRPTSPDMPIRVRECLPMSRKATLSL
jgi:hypothetical protein